MELYIIKSAACLSIFFAFYKLVLENSSLHTSKRIYLIGALLVSFIIPFITFTSYVEMEPMTTAVFTSSSINSDIASEIVVEKTNYIPFILWTVYGLGILFFGFKFSRNLFHILSKIKNNPSIKRAAFYDVLTSEQTAPHTFFNRLFFNRKSYEAKEFPQEVFWHEEAHAKQKHSADLLLIELLQVVFWFNPLCYLFKGAIKLNHEFLADREVLHKTEDTAQYQHILLSFSTPDHLRGQGLISFANSINYSSIKKRFTVMKTHTSKRAGLLKGLLILPLLAILIYGFSESKQEFITSEIAAESTSEDKILSLDISGANEIFIGNTKLILIDLENLITTEAYTKTALNIDSGVNIPFAKSVVSELVRLDIAKKMNVCSSSDGTKVLSPEDFEEIMSPLRADNNSSNLEAKQEYLTARSISIKILDNNFMEVEGVKIPKKNLYSQLVSIHTDITKKQRDRIINIHVSASGDIIYDDLLFIQKAATTYGYHRIVTPKEEIIRSKGNVPMAPASQIAADIDDVREYIQDVKKNYTKTFVLQIEISELTLNGRPVTLKNFAARVDALTKNWEETDFTSTRPNVLIASTPKSFLDKVDVEFRKTRFSKANDGMNIIPPPPPTNRRVKKGEASIIPPPPTSKKVLKGEVSLIPPPPPPHPPIVSTSRLDHLIRMAKEHAAFLYEGKRITSDKAIAMLKENPDLDVSTEHFKNSNPIVTLLKKSE